MTVLYLGLPLRVCPDRTCAVLWGTWLAEQLFLLIAALGLFTGYFITYRKGAYWRTLWRFVRGDFAGHDDDGAGHGGEGSYG